MRNYTKLYYTMLIIIYANASHGSAEVAVVPGSVFAPSGARGPCGRRGRRSEREGEEERAR